MNETGRKQGKQLLWTAVLLLAVCMTGCTHAEQAETTTQTEEHMTLETTAAPTEDTAGAASEITVGTVPLYDGAFRTMANGDSFYTPGTGHSVTDGDRGVLYYNNLLLVFTDTDLLPEERASVAEAVGGEALGQISGCIHAFQILVPNGTLTELEVLAEMLMEQEQVLYACCEYPVQIMGMADNNPWELDAPAEDRGNEAEPGGLDWWAEAIGAYTAWEYTALCQEVRVGIVDDGFMTDHEDLEGRITMITNAECNTVADHGTLISGVIAAVDNDIGIRGIADRAKLYCADLWPSDNANAYHTMAEYLTVINYMAQCGVRVVNNSWGCYTPDEAGWQETFGSACGDYEKWLEQRLEQDLLPTAEYAIVLISQLISSGCDRMILVQGAGNDGVDARYGGFFDAVTEEVYNGMNASVRDKLTAAGITYEAIDQRILVVGAVENNRDRDGNYYVAWFSNYGQTVDICAPGMEVFTTCVSDYDIWYRSAAGTSLSAPMVTGSVALLWSLDPELTVAELRQTLLSSSQVQAIGVDGGAGWAYPMLNVGAAVKTVAEDLESGQ